MTAIMLFDDRNRFLLRITSTVFTNVRIFSGLSWSLRGTRKAMWVAAIQVRGPFIPRHDSETRWRAGITRLYFGASIARSSSNMNLTSEYTSVMRANPQPYATDYKFSNNFRFIAMYNVYKSPHSYISHVIFFLLALLKYACEIVFFSHVLTELNKTLNMITFIYRFEL